MACFPYFLGHSAAGQLVERIRRVSGGSQVVADAERGIDGEAHTKNPPSRMPGSTAGGTPAATLTDTKTAATITRSLRDFPKSEIRPRTHPFAKIRAIRLRSCPICVESNERKIML